MKTRIIFLFIVQAGSACAQDFHYSQYDKAPLSLNAAHAGAVNKTQVNLNYRTQWASVSSPYKTYAFSAQHRFSKRRNAPGFIGLGANVEKQNAGNSALSILNATAALAGHVRINRVSTVGLGIQGGLIQRSFSNGDLRWGSQFNGTAYDGTIAQTEFGKMGNMSLLDVGTGVFYNYDETQSQMVTGNHDKQIQAGFSVAHLNRPDLAIGQGTDKLPMRFALHANTLFSVPNSRLAIGPGFLFQKQGTATECVLGSRFRYLLVQGSKVTGFNQEQTLSLGIFYRLKDAAIVSMEYALANYSIAMSYDLNASSLTPYSNGRGGFELSLKMAFND